MIKVWWWWWWLWKRDVGGELGISDWLITKRQLDSLVIECHRQFVNSGAALADKRWWWWWWCQHILIHLGINSCRKLKLWVVHERKGNNKDNETGTYGLVSRGSNLVWKRAVDKGGHRKQPSSHVHLLPLLLILLLLLFLLLLLLFHLLVLLLLVTPSQLFSVFCLSARPAVGFSCVLGHASRLFLPANKWFGKQRLGGDTLQYSCICATLAMFPSFQLTLWGEISYFTKMLRY